MGFKLPKKVNKNLANFGRSIDLTNKNSNLRVGAKNVVLTPAAPLYAVGGLINEATGGHTQTYNIYKAANPGGSAKTRYSTTIQAASGYQGAVPGRGKQALPVLNRSTTKGAGQVVQTVIQDVVAPAADAATKGLFGVSLRTVAWTVAIGGTGLLVGPPLVKKAFA